MLAQLGWASTENCSQFPNQQLYPVCRTAQPHAVTEASCRRCVTPVLLSWCHFSIFLPWMIWYLLWRVKGRTQHSWTPYLSSANPTLSPRAYSTKRTAQHILREGEEVTNKHGSWGNRALNDHTSTVYRLCGHPTPVNISWEPLFPSVRDQIISTWRHVKVMSISPQ